MNKLNPAKDESKAPKSPAQDDITAIVGKIQHMGRLLEQMREAYEAYLLCQSYQKADIPDQFKDEGRENQELSMAFFGDAYERVQEIWYEMVRNRREGC